jgi:hypothetical protein
VHDPLPTCAVVGRLPKGRATGPDIAM